MDIFAANRIHMTTTTTVSQTNPDLKRAQIKSASPVAAEVASLFDRYPLVRSRNDNLYAQL
jgi:hypothetical protein